MSYNKLLDHLTDLHITRLCDLGHAWHMEEMAVAPFFANEMYYESKVNLRVFRLASFHGTVSAIHMTKSFQKSQSTHM